MLEITGDDIADLADDDLRALVARLCEAELRQGDLPAAAVTWGGAQDAPDGGIDVRVALPHGTTIDGFIKSNAAVLNDLAKEVPSGMGRPAPKIWIFGARA